MIPPEAATQESIHWECYRHPGAEAGVKCRRCERPICGRCMITAPVGFQCPQCVKGAPAVRSLRSLRVEPYITYALVAVNVFVALLALSGGSISRGNGLADDFALFGPAVAAGEWWRLLTSGFLHYGLLHLGFNMLVLFQLGTLLEPAVGRLRFAALYATSLLGGAFGALLVSPTAFTAGASGAIYGLLGAVVVIMRRRGVDVMRSGLGGLLVINLLFTFVIPGISIGGHLGGLAAGAAAGLVLEAAGDRDRKSRLMGLAGCVAIAGAAGLGALVVAGA